LGWLFILCAKLRTSSSDSQRFILQVQKFVDECQNQQIRLAPVKFCQLCRRYAETSISTPLRAIKTLRTAILKVLTSPGSLTSIHSDLMQCCLLAKCYNVAIPILEDEIQEVDPQNLNQKDYLTYYYYGGMIYVGLKKYHKALEMFKLSLIIPAMVLSAIMIESYKKYVLISLLVHGQIENLPKYMILSRLKSFIQPYQEFANAFSTHNTDELHKIAQTHADYFNKDHNFGLVKQCIQSLYRRNIQQLTQTYLTLSLSDIAETVKLTSAKRAEMSILRMIEDGEIFATINQKDGMVSFNEDPEQYDTKKTLDLIDNNIHKSMELAEKIKTFDELIATNNLYIQRTSHERGRPTYDADDYYDPLSWARTG